MDLSRAPIPGFDQGDRQLQVQTVGGEVAVIAFDHRTVDGQQHQRVGIQVLLERDLFSKDDLDPRAGKFVAVIQQPYRDVRQLALRTINCRCADGHFQGQRIDTPGLAQFDI
ncbi:hypothetical protein D3C84_805650 [compost metagenome]